MSVFTNIQTALDTALASVPSVPPIAYSNIEYLPVQGTTYLRSTVLPATSSLFTLNDVHRNPGIYQVDIFFPTGKGNGAALGIADAIKTTFQTNRRLSSGGDIVFIKEISLGKGERQDAWEHIFVDISYECLSTS